MIGNSFLHSPSMSRATLLNIMFGKRIQNLRDVGFIPVVSMPVECPESIWPDVNLTLFNKCLAELTVELKRFSYQGCWLHDPHGVLRVRRLLIEERN